MASGAASSVFARSRHRLTHTQSDKEGLTRISDIAAGPRTGFHEVCTLEVVATPLKVAWVDRVAA